MRISEIFDIAALVAVGGIYHWGISDCWPVILAVGGMGVVVGGLVVVGAFAVVHVVLIVTGVLIVVIGSLVVVGTLIVRVIPVSGSAWPH